MNAPKDAAHSVNSQIVRLGAVQAAPVWLDRQGTLQKVCALIEEAGDLGIKILGFPENFVPGHPAWYYFMPASARGSRDRAVRLFQEAVEITDAQLAPVSRAAKAAGVTVILGVTEKMPDTTGTMYNTQVVIDANGAIIGKHQKLVATVTERLVHGPGAADTQRTFLTEAGRISALICGENSNPFAQARIVTDYCCVHVASWPGQFSPTMPGGVRENSLLVCRGLAYTCGTFVISSCAINTQEMIADLATNEDDRRFLEDPQTAGGSCVIDPFGKVLAGPLPGDQEGIVYADADFTDCIRSRMVHDFAGHYNRPDVYQLRVNRQQPRLVSAFEAPDISHAQDTVTSSADPRLGLTRSEKTE